MARYLAEVAVTSTYWIDVDADTEEAARERLAKFDAADDEWHQAFHSPAKITDLQVDDEKDAEEDD